jgi:hypothetical protein
MGAAVAQPDRIARELRRAMGVWRKRRDPSALRLAIERLLAPRWRTPERAGRSATSADSIWATIV